MHPPFRILPITSTLPAIAMAALRAILDESPDFCPVSPLPLLQ